MRIGIHALLGEGVKFFVQCMSSLPFALFQLNFILVAISVLPLSVAGLVKLDIRCFAVKLDILGKNMNRLRDTKSGNNLREPSFCLSL